MLRSMINLRRELLTKDKLAKGIIEKVLAKKQNKNYRMPKTNWLGFKNSASHSLKT